MNDNVLKSNLVYKKQNTKKKRGMSISFLAKASNSAIGNIKKIGEKKINT
tara:strand:- start:55 stop:204 length:150 start_codon:yes stop_codon:yes gene_type:complete